MKNRILAVLCLVLVLVPLFMLPLSAAEGDSFTIIDFYESVGLRNSPFTTLVLEPSIEHFGAIPIMYYDNTGNPNPLAVGEEIHFPLRYLSPFYERMISLGEVYIGFDIYSPDISGGYIAGVGDLFVSHEVYGEDKVLSIMIANCNMHGTVLDDGDSVFAIELLFVCSGDSENIYYPITGMNEEVEIYSFMSMSIIGNGSELCIDEVYSMISVGIAFEEKEVLGYCYLLDKLLSADDLSRTFDYWYFPQSALGGMDYGYNEGYSDGDGDGYVAGFYLGQQKGYTDGYDRGEADGFDNGFSEGYYQGETDGHRDGYNEGYDKGRSDGFTDGESSAVEGFQDFGGLVVGIFEAPGRLIDSMLDFDIFGINIASFVKVLLTLAITAVIVFFVFKLTRG